MRLADLSIEVGHIYLRDLQCYDPGEVSPAIKKRVSVARDWVAPVLEREMARKRQVSTCILVDDYFWNPGDDAMAPMELAEQMLHAFEDVELPIDHVVFEGSLAASVHHMVDRIVPKPDAPAGGVDDKSLDTAKPPLWLSNAAPAREARPRNPTRTGMSSWDEGELEPSDEPLRLPKVFGSTRSHSVRLDVELRDGSDRPWACATLAAWWQLVRLGALVVFENEWTPARTISRDGAPPLAARRTLSVLSPEFLEVEHAVRVVLGQVALDDEFRRRHANGPGAVPSHLRRMASIVAWDMSYVFVDDEFDGL